MRETNPRKLTNHYYQGSFPLLPTKRTYEDVMDRPQNTSLVTVEKKCFFFFFHDDCPFHCPWRLQFTCFLFYFFLPARLLRIDGLPRTFYNCIPHLALPRASVLGYTPCAAHRVLLSPATRLRYVLLPSRCVSELTRRTYRRYAGN